METTGQRPVFIFSHSYLVNHWREILEEQLSLLRRTGLYARAERIFFGACSPDYDTSAEFEEMVMAFDRGSKSTLRFHKANRCEKDTLIWLQDECRARGENETFVLYFHTKGVANGNRFESEDAFLKRTSWRHVMEYFCLERWPRCLEKLEGHDCVGALYAVWKWAKNNEGTEFHEYPFFSGNFWWSKSSHINRTVPLEERTEFNHDQWIECETMVTSAPHRYFNFYLPPIHPVHMLFNPGEYRMI